MTTSNLYFQMIFQTFISNHFKKMKNILIMLNSYNYFMSNSISYIKHIHLEKYPWSSPQHIISSIYG